MTIKGSITASSLMIFALRIPPNGKSHILSGEIPCHLSLSRYLHILLEAITEIFTIGGKSVQSSRQDKKIPYTLLPIEVNLFPWKQNYTLHSAPNHLANYCYPSVELAGHSLSQP